jgi:hypothetical protein
VQLRPSGIYFGRAGAWLQFPDGLLSQIESRSVYSAFVLADGRAILQLATTDASGAPAAGAVVVLPTAQVPDLGGAALLDVQVEAGKTTWLISRRSSGAEVLSRLALPGGSEQQVATLPPRTGGVRSARIGVDGSAWVVRDEGHTYLGIASATGQWVESEVGERDSGYSAVGRRHDGKLYVLQTILTTSAMVLRPIDQPGRRLLEGSTIPVASDRLGSICRTFEFLSDETLRCDRTSGDPVDLALRDGATSETPASIASIVGAESQFTVTRS